MSDPTPSSSRRPAWTGLRARPCHRASLIGALLGLVLIFASLTAGVAQGAPSVVGTPSPVDGAWKQAHLGWWPTKEASYDAIETQTHTPKSASPTAAITRTPTATSTAIVTSVPTGSPVATRIATSTATPRATATATFTATATSTASNRSTVPVEFNANLFPSINQSSFRPGDIAKAQAVRAGAAETPLARSVFLSNGVQRQAAISVADEKRLGIVKEFVFSAVADLSYLDDPAFPTDIAIIGFDFEGGMTPAVDYADPVGAATRFAAIAHAHGYKVDFSAIASMFSKLQGNGQLAQIMSRVEYVGYQAQNKYPVTGQSGFLTEMAADEAYVHGQGSAKFGAQLWSPTESCAQMVPAFQAAISAGSIDVTMIGTHSDGVTVACVMSGLRP